MLQAVLLIAGKVAGARGEVRVVTDSFVGECVEEIADCAFGTGSADQGCGRRKSRSAEFTPIEPPASHDSVYGILRSVPSPPVPFTNQNTSHSGNCLMESGLTRPPGAPENWRFGQLAIQIRSAFGRCPSGTERFARPQITLPTAFSPKPTTTIVGPCNAGATSTAWGALYGQFTGGIPIDYLRVAEDPPVICWHANFPRLPFQDDQFSEGLSMIG